MSDEQAKEEKAPKTVHTPKFVTVNLQIFVHENEGSWTNPRGSADWQATIPVEAHDAVDLNNIAGALKIRALEEFEKEAYPQTTKPE